MHLFISIHVPTRGAILFWYYMKLHHSHCNSRTLAGCDDFRRHTVHAGRYFNSRTLAWCDLGVGDLDFKNISISTHVPLRGTTWPLGG